MELVDALLVAKAGHVDSILRKQSEPEADVKLCAGIFPSIFEAERLRAYRTNAPGDWLRLIDVIYDEIKRRVGYL